jgi:hypothetical protein
MGTVCKIALCLRVGLSTNPYRKAKRIGKLTQKQMKTLAFISGALSSCISIIGILFKIQHWPGANILLVLGLGTFSTIFIPSLTKYLYDKEK